MKTRPALFSSLLSSVFERSGLLSLTAAPESRVAINNPPVASMGLPGVQSRLQRFAVALRRVWGSYPDLKQAGGAA